MGYCGVDMDCEDMKKILFGNWESILYCEVKYMLDIEFECLGGILSVQVFFFFGDLECGVGCDNMGWMYFGK